MMFTSVEDFISFFMDLSYAQLKSALRVDGEALDLAYDGDFRREKGVHLVESLI
jgi:hypothetical protein